MLGLDADEIEPAALITAILLAEVDLLWFGGIGTYVKARGESQQEVGDPGNDAIRVNAADLRVKAIGEGANLGITQAARIEFSQHGGRINTDFIDNSAGVDCSDNEVNIKIPLNGEMLEGRLDFDERNALLAEMTDDVARARARGQSAADAGALDRRARRRADAAAAGPGDRDPRGKRPAQPPGRRARIERGIAPPRPGQSRPDPPRARHPALDLEDAAAVGDRGVEASPTIPTLVPELCAAFPKAMQKKHGDAILAHRLKKEIIATKVANRFVNRLGIVAPFSLTEEEGASFGQAAAAFLAAERLFRMDELWAAIDEADVPEEVRLALFEQASTGLQLHIADLLRCTAPDNDARRDRRQAEARPRQAGGDGRRSAPARRRRPRPAACAPSWTRWARRGRSPAGSSACSS